MIGDTAEDVKAGQAVEVMSVLVSTGDGSTHQYLLAAKMPYVNDLLKAAHFVEDN